MIELTDKRKSIIETAGNLLIMGGPGSGKTTIGLLKANSVLSSELLKPYQKILFLSFANATIARVNEHTEKIVDKAYKEQLHISTYHSFAWEILKSHGYLLNGKKTKLLIPSQANARLSTVTDKTEEKSRLFDQEGLIHFDLFAPKCSELLKNSKSLLKIITNTFPIIILDEFQDTNQDEWEFIQELGKYSTLIALADLEQRIYDFRGADPLRIEQFTAMFKPSVFDFGKENNRSNGTDICNYGNDILSGKNIGKDYNEVKVVKYQFKKNNLHLLNIKYHIFEMMKVYNQNNINDWSIAVIVPTNLLMIEISDFLNSSQTLSSGKIAPSVTHNTAIDMSGPTIVATIIANLLDVSSQKKCSTLIITKEISRYLLGKGGEKTPSKANIALVDFLTGYSVGSKITGKNRVALIKSCEELADACNDIVFTGDVGSDWRLLCNAIKNTNEDIFQKIYYDSKFIKLLHKGSFLSSALDQLWKKSENYAGATEVVEAALTQEHFSTSVKIWDGVNVMTIHKAKGKEFNEVIIYESSVPGKRYIFNSDNVSQTRLNLRVAVTRAKDRAFILTPSFDPCPLL